MGDGFFSRTQVGFFDDVWSSDFGLSPANLVSEGAGVAFFSLYLFLA